MVNTYSKWINKFVNDKEHAFLSSKNVSNLGECGGWEHTRILVTWRETRSALGREVEHFEFCWLELVCSLRNGQGRNWCLFWIMCQDIGATLNFRNRWMHAVEWPISGCVHSAPERPNMYTFLKPARNRLASSAECLHSAIWWFAQLHKISAIAEFVQ